MSDSKSPAPVYILGPAHGVSAGKLADLVIPVTQGLNNNAPNPTSGLDLVTGNSNISTVVSGAISSMPNLGPIGYLHDATTVVGTLIQGREVNTYVATGGGLGSALGGLAGGIVGSVLVGPGGGTYGGASLGSVGGAYLGAELGYANYINNNAPDFKDAINLPPTYVRSDGTPYWVLGTTDRNGDPFTFVYTKNNSPAYIPGGPILPVRDAETSARVIRESIIANGVDPDITPAQFNLRNGHGVSGYAPGTVHYEKAPHGGHVQVSTYKDPNTNAIVEARMYGSLSDHVFKPAPGAVPIASGYIYSEDVNHKPSQTHVIPPLEEVLSHVFPGLDPKNYSNEGRNYPNPIIHAETNGAGAVRDKPSESISGETKQVYFKPGTSLANVTESSDPSIGIYTIQSGDTVPLIAQRLGMSVGELSTFLRGQYGPAADLNSIVTGRGLPVPADQLQTYGEHLREQVDVPRTGCEDSPMPKQTVPDGFVFDDSPIDGALDTTRPDIGAPRASAPSAVITGDGSDTTTDHGRVNGTAPAVQNHRTMSNDQLQQCHRDEAGQFAQNTPANTATPHDSMDALFDRLTDAAIAKDVGGMRAVGQEYWASADGQQWFKSGQEHNEAQRAREATEREAARQAEMEAVAAQATHEHRAPVRSL